MSLKQSPENISSGVATTGAGARVPRPRATKTTVRAAQNVTPLWFCSGCSKPIRPLGSSGTVHEDGRRFCAACLPFEVLEAPPAESLKTMGSSSARLALTRSGASGRTQGISSARINALSESATGRISAAQGSLLAAKQSGRKLLWAGVAALAVMALLVAGIFLKSGSRNQSAVQLKQLTAGKALAITRAPETSAASPKSATAAAAAGEKLTDKEERHLALARSGGLFGTAVPGGDARATIAAAPAPTVNAPPELPSPIKPEFLSDESQKLKSVTDATTAAAPETKAIESVKYDDDAKRLALLGTMFEKIEKLKHPKLSKSELDASMLKLQEFKTRIEADGASINRFAERLAALNIDLRLAHGPERLFYDLVSCEGDNCELKFEFSSRERLAGWNFEGDGENSGGLEIDLKKKALLVNVTGAHAYGAKRHSPLAQIPFYFNAANWSLEADLSVLKTHEHEKARNPSYGIYVSDGESAAIRFGAQESGNGMLQLSAQAPGTDEKDKDKVAGIPRKQEEKIRLRMDCKNGVVKFGATAGRPVTSGQARIDFVPKFAGIFVETRDKDENASIAVTYFKLTGAWDKERVQKAVDARRLTDGAVLKAELLNSRRMDAGAK